MMRLVKVSVIYFALVFGTGFILGTIRVLWLVPRLGVRKSEFLELPLMILVTVIAARWINRRFLSKDSSTGRLWVGWVSFGLLVAAELAIGIGMQGRSFFEILIDRDPISGAVYYGSLILFAIMPWLVGRSWLRRG